MLYPLGVFEMGLKILERKVLITRADEMLVDKEEFLFQSLPIE